ncbi:MAG: glycosyltransferase family 39 protein [Acidobacteriota bacterium]
MRALALAVAPSIRPEGDEHTYIYLAARMAQGDGFVEHGGIIRAPGYSAFVALVSFTGLGAELAARIAQVVLAVATQVSLVAVLQRTHGSKVAVAASWVLAVYPETILYALLLRPETLYVALFAVATALAFRILASTGATAWREAVGAGACFGIACLVRSIPLYFLPLAGAWLVLHSTARRRAALAAALVVACAMATILPWTIRNARHYHRFLPVDATLGYNMAIGNNLFPPPNWEVGRGSKVSYELCADENLVDRDRCNVKRALRFIRENPFLFLARIPVKLADFWGPPAGIMNRIRAGTFGNLPAWTAGATGLLYHAVMVSAAIGVALPARGAASAPQSTSRFSPATRSRSTSSC